MKQTTKLKITGMSNLNTVTHVQKALEAVPGVTDASVTQDEGATVEHDGADPQQLLRAVESLGGLKAEVVR